MSEYHKTNNVSVSAMRADVSRPTARKYLQSQMCPEEQQVKHTWRTRTDPLSEIWTEAHAMLENAPDLEAKALFEYLLEAHPGKLEERHLRTFQRRVRQWKLIQGKDKEVFFPQDWEPGRAMQLDWTHAAELGVTIQGRFYDHLLCHTVLPHSNWEWATRCKSESLLSLRHGLQASLHQLGRAPWELRVDHSSAATHQIGSGSGRTFNADFVSICAHYRLKPCTIGVACPNENGDVESSNGHLKRRLNQHLLLRGSRDFCSEGDYQGFLVEVIDRANQGRAKSLADELAVMQPLPPTRLSEYDEVYCTVSSASTIRVKKVTYSVPARFIGHQLKVEVYESELRIYSGRDILLTLPRETGDRGVILNYRHVIDHLLRKPGAFERYRYQEGLFPHPLFRQACDLLMQMHGNRTGTLEYLRLLKLASEVGEERLLLLLVEYLVPPLSQRPWLAAELRQIVQGWSRSEIEVSELKPDCTCYDSLLSQVVEVSHAS